MCTRDGPPVVRDLGPGQARRRITADHHWQLGETPLDRLGCTGTAGPGAHAEGTAPSGQELPPEAPIAMIVTAVTPENTEKICSPAGAGEGSRSRGPCCQIGGQHFAAGPPRQQHQVGQQVPSPPRPATQCELLPRASPHRRRRPSPRHGESNASLPPPSPDRILPGWRGLPWIRRAAVPGPGGSVARKPRNTRPL